MRPVFADTSYFIALIAPRDIAHDRAVRFGVEARPMVTSAWVMLELGAYLARGPNRALFTELLDGLRQSNDVTFFEAERELFDAGLALYADRQDKEWSLVDCISFVLMQRVQLNDALTTDHHFVQAGFNALLIDSTD